jgi:hypothetical protein
LTRPVAKIISAVKSGSTTATLTLDRAHGLAVGALITVYGIRDQAAAAFPNITTATAITAVPAANKIQIGPMKDIFLTRFVLGVLLGLILIPVAILKKLFIISN